MDFQNLEPDLDLMLERVVDVPRELMWAGWTVPEQLKKWFTPAPWTTVDCEIDLRPGGRFRVVMRSPEGKEFSNVGCYLEIVKNEKLVWTSALEPGYRPSARSACGGELECGNLLFTAAILLQQQGNATKYRALVMHADEASRRKHEDMGFHDGWGRALDQLVVAAKNFNRS